MEYLFYHGFYHNKLSKRIRILPLIFIIDRATQMPWLNIMNYNAYCGDMLSHQVGKHHKSVGHYYPSVGIGKISNKYFFWYIF